MIFFLSKERQKERKQQNREAHRMMIGAHERAKNKYEN